ncbi:MAG: mersacidin/lichenicidin family type 2 lantibiotic [Acidobacteriota bacterium]
MKKIDTVRALRDADYRNSLSQAELAQLPANPAGISSVEDTALKSVTGGCGPTLCNTCGGGPGPTSFLWSCTGPNTQCP